MTVQRSLFESQGLVFLMEIWSQSPCTFMVMKINSFNSEVRWILDRQSYKLLQHAFTALSNVTFWEVGQGSFMDGFRLPQRYARTKWVAWSPMLDIFLKIAFGWEYGVANTPIYGIDVVFQHFYVGDNKFSKTSQSSCRLDVLLILVELFMWLTEWRSLKLGSYEVW